MSVGVVRKVAVGGKEGQNCDESRLKRLSGELLVLPSAAWDSR